MSLGNNSWVSDGSQGVEEEEHHKTLKPHHDQHGAEANKHRETVDVHPDLDPAYHAPAAKSAAHIRPMRKTNTTFDAKAMWARLREEVGGIAGEGFRERSEPTPENALGHRDINVVDPDNPTEKEAYHFLEMIRNSEFFDSLPEKLQKGLIMEQERKDGKIHALDQLTQKEKGEHFLTEEEEYVHDRKHREREQDENRLRHLWDQRSALKNYTLLLLFHGIVMFHLLLCLYESFRIVIEHSDFDRLYLSDDFNCLEIIASGDSVNHLFNILHGFACAAVLFTDRLDSANLCWMYVFAQLGHAMCDTFQFCYNIRLPMENKRDDSPSNVCSFVAYIAFEILTSMIVIQRYYDMTDIIQKRNQGFTASIYSGRLLNEHIIYKNESDFLQKKYTLRQATSLQIYGIVQKIQHFKERGAEPNHQELNIDVKAAIAALKDVEAYAGPNLLRELRIRNSRRLEELHKRFSKGSVTEGV